MFSLNHLQRLHVFGLSLECYKDIDYYREHLTGVIAEGYKTGDIIELFDSVFFVVNDDLKLEMVGDDSENDTHFTIGLSVTKNIHDFRGRFKEVLKICDDVYNIESIEIRTDDVFIIEQLGRAFDDDVNVSFVNSGETHLKISKFLKMDERYNNRGIYAVTTIACTYDIDKVKGSHFLTNIRIADDKKVRDDMHIHDWILQNMNVFDDSNLPRVDNLHYYKDIITYTSKRISELA